MIEGYGIPDEAYGLAITCLVGFFLSGGNAPLVGAAFLLSFAWSRINSVWPTPGEGD